MYKHQTWACETCWKHNGGRKVPVVYPIVVVIPTVSPLQFLLGKTNKETNPFYWKPIEAKNKAPGPHLG